MHASLFFSGIPLSVSKAFFELTHFLCAAAWVHVLSSTVGRQTYLIISVFGGTISTRRDRKSKDQAPTKHSDNPAIFH